MALEVLGFFLFSLGLFIMYISFQYAIDESYFYIIFPLSVLMVSFGAYLIYLSLPLYLILKKFFGFVLAVIGYWFIFRFPDAEQYQFPSYTLVGVLVGIIAMSWGLYLLLF